MYSPVLVKTVNDIYVAVTESDLDDYPGMFLQGSGNEILEGAFAAYPLEERIVEGEYPEMVVSKRAGLSCKNKRYQKFSLAGLLIAREDKDLPANDLVYGSHHHQQSKMPPGFIRANAQTNGSLTLIYSMFLSESGINTASYKYYIDFAKRFGFDRIMMDAGWSDTKDLFKINPRLNMDSIVRLCKIARDQTQHVDPIHDARQAIGQCT